VLTSLTLINAFIVYKQQSSVNNQLFKLPQIPSKLSRSVFIWDDVIHNCFNVQKEEWKIAEKNLCYRVFAELFELFLHKQNRKNFVVVFAQALLSQKLVEDD
jgi:hypothetical protein